MTFSVKVEADLIELETAVDWLLLEDGLTNLLQESDAGFDFTTSYLLYGSLVMKFNTFDFELLTPPLGAIQLTDTITTTDPAWTGTVTAFESRDPVMLRNSQQIVHVTATNTKALPSDTAPFDLSDVPSVGPYSDYLLEDGSGHYLIESGTDFAPGALMLEQTLSFGYSGLSVRSITGSPPTTLGKVVVQQVGLRPGNMFKLTSANQGITAKTYQVNQATITWPQGANPPAPKYNIEFGDTPQTLAQWATLTAPSAITPLSAPTSVAPGVIIYGYCTAVQNKLWAQGGGIVTIASATFTVSAPAGHSLTVQLIGAIDCIAYAWDNTVATPRRAVRGTISGGIYTGAWQELTGGWTGGSTVGFRATVDISSGLGIALASGTYTVTIDIDTQQFNQIQVYSAFAEASVTTV